MILESNLKSFSGAAVTAVENKVAAPVPAPKPQKPAAKKPPVKKVAAKPAAKPKAESTRRTPYGDDQIIKLSKTWDADAYKGSRGARAKLLKDGISVGDWEQASRKKADKGIKNWLHALVEAGVLSVK